MGDLNIFPEKIVKTKDSNGNKYHSEVYSLEALANLNLFGFLAISLLIGCFLPLIPVVLILIYCLSVNDEEDKTGILLISILMSTYFLFDISNDWLASAFMKFAYGKKFRYIMPINITSVIINLVLILIGKSMYRIIKEKVIFSLIIGILFLIIFLITKGIIEN